MDSPLESKVTKPKLETEESMDKHIITIYCLSDALLRAPPP